VKAHSRLRNDRLIRVFVQLIVSPSKTFGKNQGRETKYLPLSISA
jgi:hypothetical protein